MQKFRLSQACVLVTSLVSACFAAPVVAQAASFYDAPSAFCGTVNQGCSADHESIIRARPRFRRGVRVLHAIVPLGCDVAGPAYQAKIITQNGHDRCKISFTEAFRNVPFLTVASKPDTPDITSYSIPTVIEAGPSYAIVETVQVSGSQAKLYHGGFEIFAQGQ